MSNDKVQKLIEMANDVITGAKDPAFRKVAQPEAEAPPKEVDDTVAENPLKTLTSARGVIGKINAATADLDAFDDKGLIK